MQTSQNSNIIVAVATLHWKVRRPFKHKYACYHEHCIYWGAEGEHWILLFTFVQHCIIKMSAIDGDIP